MSCDISIGRGLKCTDSVGGIKNIYFVPFETMTNVVVDDYNRITSVGGNPNAYQFEVIRDADLDQTVTSSSLTGTTYVQQVLRATLKQLDYITDDAVMKLAYSKPHIIVEDLNRNFFLLGLRNGSDMRTANVKTGRAMGDLSGYQLVFTCEELRLANYISGSLASVGFNVVEPEDIALVWNNIDVNWELVDVNWESNFLIDL